MLLVCNSELRDPGPCNTMVYVLRLVEITCLDGRCSGQAMQILVRLRSTRELKLSSESHEQAPYLDLYY